jgi:von Willebrand factor type D domain/Effector protein
MPKNKNNGDASAFMVPDIRHLNRLRQATMRTMVVSIPLLASLAYCGPASATVDVGADLHRQYDDCIAKFTGAGLRDLVDALDRSSNSFTIRRSNRASSGSQPNSREDAQAGPPGTGGNIDWNPDATPPLPRESFNQDPCATLYHEMSHLVDYDQGLNDYRNCAQSQVPINETRATRAENRYRKTQPDLKDKLRKWYDGKGMPDDDVRCDPKPSRDRERRGCSGGCAMSNGDVHLTTFDQRNYDFHSVGEFVLTRSKDDLGFEIQSRQSPLPDTSDVSVNSAVALNISGDRVGFYMTPDGSRLLINGKPAALGQTRFLLGKGGDIAFLDDGEISVLWPDDSEALLFVIGRYGYRIRIHAAPQHHGRLEGLLGDYDGRPENDLIVRGGSPLPDETFRTLYASFDDSWRIIQAASLFDYKGNLTTEDYTDRRFPHRPILLDTHPNKANAERICRSHGVTTATQFRACALDVAVTGITDFAQSAADTEKRIRLEETSERGRHNAGTPVALAFSGAFSGSLNRPVVDCTRLQSANQFTITIKGMQAGARLELFLTIVSTFHGPGEYGVGSLSTSDTVAALSRGDLSYASSGERIGRLVVNEGLRTGRIDADLGALHVSGGWTCTTMNTL